MAVAGLRDDGHDHRYRYFHLHGAVLLGTRNARFTLREARSYTVAEQARTAWNNKPFMVLMLVKFTQLLGLASVGPIILFSVPVCAG